MATSTLIRTVFLSRRPSSLDNVRFGRNCCRVSMKSRVAPPAPWLTLPPVFEGGDLVYKFYKLQDGVVESIPKRRNDFDFDLPPDDAKLVGSSDGWLAFFDEQTTHVFLSNPISRRHIKLPRIDTLPNPEFNMFDEGRRCISRVILSSSSPGDGTCRAITTFGPGRRLAYCVPGVSTEWTPVGEAVYPLNGIPHYKNIDHVRYAMPPKEDFVYSNQVLTCISDFEFEFCMSQCECHYFAQDQLLFCDEQPPLSTIWNYFNFVDYPRETAIVDNFWCFDYDLCSKQHLEMLKKECFQIPHLFYAEDLSPDPLILLRFVNRGIGYNASPADPKLARPVVYRAMIDAFPYKTVDFLVLSHSTTDLRCTVVKDLKGLALFVGMNHSFAIPAADYPGVLKPDCIYFTDACRISSPDPDAKKIYGGHDIGVFDYKTKTVSPCNYPCDFQNFQRIDPPPMWFTPNPN